LVLFAENYSTELFTRGIVYSRYLLLNIIHWVKASGVQVPLYKEVDNSLSNTLFKLWLANQKYRQYHVTTNH